MGTSPSSYIQVPPPPGYPWYDLFDAILSPLYKVDTALDRVAVQNYGVVVLRPSFSKDSDQSNNTEVTESERNRMRLVA